MLAESVQEWTKQWREEGRQEGRQEGGVNIVSLQLEQKFGPTLPFWVSQKLKSASLNEIKIYARRLLDARSLEEIFE
ncbi:MAG: DUF4351 domain-containing protein [Magnetococcales bacterium]|nr:DUF4351 domain-containing protein [Magnetococcales bacterium]